VKYVFIILSIVLFAGCSLKDAQIKTSKTVEIYDLVNIPQDVTFFSKNIEKNAPLHEAQVRYAQRYFHIWNIDKPKENLNSIKWPFIAFRAGKNYGENLQPLEQSFFDMMLENANFEAYATFNAKAVTLKEVNLRAFPTIRPLLKDPSLAGEGFPFDYLQNSTIHANEPIFVSHYSKDREWAYVFSNFASGWIKTDKFAILEKEHIKAWQNAQQIAIIKEGEPIYDIDGNFLFKSKIGMMFALISEDEKVYTVLSVASYKNSKPLFLKSKISKNVATKEILRLDENSLTAIVNEVSKTNYGWGGMYEQRDCSSMLRDMFAPFGIWLPRNSLQQSKIGRVISLSDLSDEEKINIIKEKAVPFQTLLYKKGHVVLYVGTYNGEIIVFHNTWGIRTKKDGVEGRVVVGKAVFSSLNIGKYVENYDEESSMLKNLISMNIITQ
jgi:hypothetical protein